ncbi:plakophilin-1 [Synchiropus picturatus]
MTALEPLRSATTIVCAEDTSLALPSDNELRSGHLRVREQVSTLKRSKSKQGWSGSLHSPTTPPHSSKGHSGFGTFTFIPSKFNSTSSRSFSLNTGKAANVKKSMSTRSAGMLASRSAVMDVDGSSHALNSNGLRLHQSDSSFVPAFTKSSWGGTEQVTVTQRKRESVHVTNGVKTSGSQSRLVQQPTCQSEVKLGVSKTEQQAVANSTHSLSDLTVKEAVDFLSNDDETFQQCGATFIQHITYKEERSKQEVAQLGGIPALVTLLRSPNPSVSQAAAGALRNLVFKDLKNKMSVQHCGGIAKSLQLLKETDSTETQKQITGLLWNLSSADELKGELIATALPALTESVVVPFTGWCENISNNNVHPDVFYNATGCLRNLSCAQKKERKAMRDCPGMVDSLVTYLQACVAEENPDDKSVENCACILHNLTYQLESEAPECFAKYNPPTLSGQNSAKSPPIGCFSPKSGKAQKQFGFDCVPDLPEDSNPTGVKWLFHPKAMQAYLSLLGSSQKDATLEACCGALQNLTASPGPASSAISQVLVQKLAAVAHMSPLLKSSNPKLQRTAMSLLSNMSRSGGVQRPMAKQILPQLASLIAAGPREFGNSDDTVASACSTLRNLMLVDPEISRKVINADMMSSLADLSENGSFAKGSKAASLLLYSLWNDKNTQAMVKKLGLSKSFFVNDNTTAVHKSVQVVD